MRSIILMAVGLCCALAACGNKPPATSPSTQQTTAEPAARCQQAADAVADFEYGYRIGGGEGETQARQAADNARVITEDSCIRHAWSAQTIECFAAWSDPARRTPCANQLTAEQKQPLVASSPAILSLEAF